MDQPSPDDLPDDFKVGVVVIDCDADIRLAFIRKVYSILFIQLLATAAVGLGMSTHAAVTFAHENPWVVWVPMIGSFASLFATYVKRHDYPVNMVLLGLFTLCEAVMVGAITSYYESKIVSVVHLRGRERGGECGQSVWETVGRVQGRSRAGSGQEASRGQPLASGPKGSLRAKMRIHLRRTKHEGV
jgi:hypothetical protein